MQNAECEKQRITLSRCSSFAEAEQQELRVERLLRTPLLEDGVVITRACRATRAICTVLDVA